MRRDLLFLKDIINAMNKIFNYTEKMTKEEFKKDDRTIDAVLRNIEIIGEAANKLSKKIYKENESVPWGRMIGLRNIVIHEYFGVDLNIIWQVITVNLPETKPKIEEILKEISWFTIIIKFLLNFKKIRTSSNRVFPLSDIPSVMMFAGVTDDINR